MSTPEDEQTQGPACSQCRRKKQKCTRGVPCRSCLASGALCVYEEGKRRGARPGFIEALAKRMETLEAIVLGQSMLIASRLGITEQASDERQPPRQRIGSLDTLLDAARNDLLQLNARKRKRSLSAESDHADAVSEDKDNLLPSDDLFLELCAIYFNQIHPWIPILHQPTFYQALRSDHKPHVTILQAITAVTIKYAPVPPEVCAKYYKSCRDAVLLSMMESFSVDMLQASIIIAYDTIGSGRGPRSWSIVASATRVVEQLGLAVEEDSVSGRGEQLFRRVGLLTPPRNWTESECRRRVFWTIFLMDRFCSVTTGWNKSLTSVDVRRRLPVEGTLWRDQVARKTRYFNISGSENGNDSVGDNDAGETEALGGFAYLIEATECLARVVTFLLREPSDFSYSCTSSSSGNAADGLRRWFDAFQGLDAMLVRWKTFLPERWQVAGVDAAGRMDENLTLAHITHNTSVILLHQNVAYPDAALAEFGSGIARLPSASSAQTCSAAALEIATISAQFLRHMPSSVPSPQFAFCVFVAARALLAHAFHYDGQLEPDPSFHTLLNALETMSERWAGPHGSANYSFGTANNLAGQFAARLKAASHAHSPVDVRLPAIDDAAGPSMSLAASPAFLPDVFRQSSFANMPNEQSAPTAPTPRPMPPPAEIGHLGDLGLAATLQDFDRIFAWGNETVN